MAPASSRRTIDSPINRDWPAKKQYTQVGSFLRVKDPDNRLALTGSFTLHAFINSTLPDIGVRQGLLGRWSIDRNEGYCLGINQKGYLEFWVGDGTQVDYVAAEVPLVARVWYFVAVSVRCDDRARDDPPAIRAQPLQQPAVQRRADGLSLAGA
jgi:N,N-dimethylformamidase